MGRSRQQNDRCEDNQDIQVKRCIGFNRVDRIEILRPQFCERCGVAGFSLEPIKIEVQQVAQLGWQLK